MIFFGQNFSEFSPRHFQHHFIYHLGNKIGDEGAKALAISLAKNRTLEVLVLNKNNIGRLGFQYFITALLINTRLVVHLKNNWSMSSTSTYKQKLNLQERSLYEHNEAVEFRIN